MFRLLTLVALLCAGSLSAATITVTDLNDDTLVNLAGDGQISLREAIEAANTDTSVDGSTAGSGADVIVFATGANGTLTTDIEDLVKSFGPTAFVINSDITIDATVNSNTVELQIAGTVVRLRHFGVLPSATLTLRGLTLSGGVSLGGKGGDGIGGGGGAGMGGAIFNCGSLVLESCTLSGNTAQGGERGIYVSGIAGDGGGGSIGGDGGDGSNGAGGGGAGVNGDGASSATGLGGPNENGAQAAQATDGTAGGGGGGVNGAGTAGDGTALSAAGLGGGGGGTNDGAGGDGGFGAGGGGCNGASSTPGSGGFGGGRGSGIGASTGTPGYGAFIGGAGMGGAIFNHGGDVDITGCNFNGNSALASGGSQPGQGLGGALFSRNGSVTIRNVTFTSNTAANQGDDMFVVADAATASIDATVNGLEDVATDEINGGMIVWSVGPDSYMTDEDVLLSVNAASGLLANDNALTANPSATAYVASTTTTQGGTIALNADGSFDYTPTPNFIGTDSFVYEVHDGSTVLGGSLVTITVTNIDNDAPVVTAPAYQPPDAGGVVTLSAANANQVSIADPDAGTSPIQVILTVVSGTLQLATTTGLTVVFGADGSSFIAFTGALTDVNSALDGLMLTLPVGETGTLSILVDDLGNTGPGGPLTASANVTLAAKPSSGGGDDDDEGCTTGTSHGFAWLALLGVIVALGWRARGRQA